MKKTISILLISVFLAILDNSIMPFFAIKNVYGSLLFVFAIFISVNGNYIEGIILGIFTGFLQDIFFFNGIGINMLTNMLTLLFATYIGNLIIKEKRIIPILLTFILTFIKGNIIFVILYIGKKYFPYNQIFTNSIYNLFIGLVSYKLVYNFCHSDLIKETWRL